MTVIPTNVQRSRQKNRVLRQMYFHLNFTSILPEEWNCDHHMAQNLAIAARIKKTKKGTL